MVRFTLNGNTVEAEGEQTLLSWLRDQARLTGAKNACGEGTCGACSVILDGMLVNACLVPAVQAQGSTLRTVESLAGVDLSPLQEAFLHHGGAQCGFCTPGMLVAGTHLLETNAVQDEAGAREGLAGNLCRCTGYVKIVDALLATREGRP